MKKYKILNLLAIFLLMVMSVLSGKVEGAKISQETMSSAPAATASPATAPAVSTVRCAALLQPHLDAIRSLDEGRKLLERIASEGPLTIAVADNSVTEKFAACWDYENRTILIGLAAKPSEGEIISSILFELHNAVITSELDKLDKMALQKKIDKHSYVRSVEHFEYMNSVNASKIVSSGVQKGVFPKNARLLVYKDFEEYFYYQKISGHSDIIGNNYDMLMQSYGVSSSS